MAQSPKAHLPDTSISALPARGSVAAEFTVSPPPAAGDMLPIALAISVVLHAIILLITFAPPDSDSSKFAPHLDVVLVNSKSASKPLKADALAQANLDGGGNTESDRRAKTPLPKVNNLEPAREVKLSSRQIHRLEQEAQRLLLLSQGTHVASDSIASAPKLPREALLEDPAAEQQRLRIAQLEAQIAKEWDEYQKLPRRKFIGARTEGVVYAEYVDRWRQRVEQVGTQHFPEEARQRKLYGSLVMTVHIRADGSVEKVEIDRSSGYRLLDSAAVRAVDLAGPFPPFPAAVRKDWDILSISRTFSYTRSDLEVLANP